MKTLICFAALALAACAHRPRPALVSAPVTPPAAAAVNPMDGWVAENARQDALSAAERQAEEDSIVRRGGPHKMARVTGLKLWSRRLGITRPRNARSALPTFGCVPSQRFQAVREGVND